MKRILLCTFMLCCCISSMFAQMWTDENGVSWDFEPNGNEATITYAYNFGTEVVVPEKVTMEWPDGNGNSVIQEYTVTGFGFDDNYYHEPIFRTGKENITKVILPSTIKVIGKNAFDGCSSLTNVGGLSNCISIGSCAFYGCSSLASVGDLPACTSIGNDAFYDCSSLTSVGDLPVCISIGSYAFNSCYALENIGDLPECVAINERAFYNCSSLKSIGNLPKCEVIGDGAFLCEDYYKYIDGENKYIEVNSSLASIGNLPACKTIGVRAFYYCNELTTIGDLLACESIKSEAFYSCEKLTSINLSSCTSIGKSAFTYCRSLQSFGDLSACTSIGEYAFNDCSSLESVGDLSACTSIGGWAFAGCKTITIIPDLSTCPSIGGGVFSNCSSLKNVDLTGCDSIPSSMFSGCSSLESLSGLTNCTSIGNYAFNNCFSLTNIPDLPECETIGSSAFYNCSSLKTIGALPKCKTIGSHAFACKGYDDWSNGYHQFIEIKSSLTSIGDLSVCTSIGEGAFEGCDVLKSITLPSAPPTLANTNSVGTYMLIRVPEQDIATYKAANIWSDPSIKNRIISSNGPIDYVVTNTALNTGTPGLAKEIADEDMLKVVTLKVSGTINSYDIIVMNNWMPNLRWLDLTDATIEACDYEYYTGEKTTDNVIGNRMFYDQDEYVSIKLPKNVVSIGNEAFGYCGNLKEVVMHEGVTSIGEGAFQVCSNLPEILIPEGCERVEYYAFGNCSKLQTVAFPTTLKSIGDYAFQSCSSLTKISLPKQLNRIGYAAFRSCSNLEELKIPSSVMYIGNEAFRYCDKLKDVYTYTIEPTTIIQETFSNYQTTTLHVPYTSHAIYRINTEWSQFLNSGQFDIIKEPYEYFYINKDYVLDDQTGVIEGKPDGEFNPGSGFIQDSEEDQEMGDIHIKDDGNTSGSIIGNGNINADNLFFDMTIEGGRWYFFCFPFKVYLSDITCPGQHVWRKYDGKKRADMGEGGWVDLDADEDHLKKGYGYIFQASQSGTLTLKVTNAQFGKFENADHHHVVEGHPAEDENNASWNFMGNPHTSYYGIGEMGYDAPITIWTGTTYEALRPGDDDYYLKPFQAFFVQKPVGTDKLVFAADSKTTYLQSEQAKNEAKARRLARGINPDRLLVNLTLSDGTHTDKTRVVFNDKQSMGYEMACDAAKFMSTEGTPQLYTLDNKHIRYAINERPNGDVTMGYSVGKEGTYTISVARMDKPMVLRDLEMGITFDLSNGDYTFTSKAGTNEKRFVLSANQSETGIADIMKETGVNIMAVEGGIHIGGLNGQTVYIYDLSGAAVATQTTDGTTAVKAGTYVVKVDSLSTKLLVK